ncbi:MAG: KH domain-containing protein [Candidatus Nealsonbacteria bacterium]|nr:KH domain-containing protein [Candidatus Nealsonbacteria bacterium]
MEFQNSVKKIIEEFFERAAFEVEVEVLPQSGSTLPVNIKTDEPQILIGQNGQTLFEIQHILRAILRKKIGREEFLYIDLDINDYKKKKIDYLKELAKSAADEVALMKQEKILEPMSAYERRIIHLELANRPDIVSESTGEEPERKIIIKLKP